MYTWRYTRKLLHQKPFTAKSLCTSQLLTHKPSTSEDFTPNTFTLSWLEHDLDMTTIWRRLDRASREHDQDMTATWLWHHRNMTRTCIAWLEHDMTGTWLSDQNMPAGTHQGKIEIWPKARHGSIMTRKRRVLRTMWKWTSPLLVDFSHIPQWKQCHCLVTTYFTQPQTSQKDLRKTYSQRKSWLLQATLHEHSDMTRREHRIAPKTKLRPQRGKNHPIFHLLFPAFAWTFTQDEVKRIRHLLGVISVKQSMGSSQRRSCCLEHLIPYLIDLNPRLLAHCSSFSRKTAIYLLLTCSLSTAQLYFQC